MSMLALALAVLSQHEQAREQILRGLLLDPDNVGMKFFCLRAAAYMRDDALTFTLFEAVLEDGAPTVVAGIAVLPDLAHMRNDPRYEVLMKTAQANLAATAHMDFRTTAGTD